MNIESKNRNIYARIAVSFFYWMCVAVAFPIVAIFAKEAGITQELKHESIFEITKYLDKHLFLGLVVACGFLYTVSSLVNRLLGKINSNTKRDLPEYAWDEICSQIVTIGSIITVVPIMQGIMKLTLGALGEFVVMYEHWWLGPIIWGSMCFFDWLARK